MKRALTCAKVLLLAAALPAFAADEPSAARDLVVYGATPEKMWAFEPHVAQRILEDWMRTNGIPVVLNEPMTLGKGGVKTVPGATEGVLTVTEDLSAYPRLFVIGICAPVPFRFGSVSATPPERGRVAR